MVKPSSVDSKGVKKGAWSEEEDNKLRACIQRYGHWNWRLLPKYAGLARCGKSCRLRWVNYLKPGVKRGNYSKEEEDCIMELHVKLGNKWSTIAAELPRRTDNDIKNYWHSHVSKKNKRIVAQTGVMEQQPYEPSPLLQLIHEEQSNPISPHLTTLMQLDQNDVVEAESSCLQDLKNSVPSLNNPDTTSWDLAVGNFWTEPFLADTSLK